MKWFVCSLLFASSFDSHAQSGVLDLTQLENYANQPIPSYITKDNTPGTNGITDLGATLGRVLFYDKRLSVDETVSCSSCHQQEHGFGDLADASVGVAGTTGRHSMRLINSRFATEVRFFWDERAVTLEDQTTRPIQDHVEMGFSGADGDPAFSDLVTRLSAIEEYKVLYTGVFGDATITEGRTQQALAQFVRSIQSFDSKYDMGLSTAPNPNAPFVNFTPAENRGKGLFQAPPPQGGAGCAGCHRAPEFDIDPNSGNNGVIGSLGGGTDFTNTRSPSLRDIVGLDGSLNGNLMHNARFDTLRGMINHYDAIPSVGPGLDPRLRPGGNPQRLNLTNQEKNDLEAFLRTLTGSAVYTDERWSSPFDVADELTAIVLPVDEVEMNLENDMVTLSSPGVPNVTYLIKTSTDLVSWDNGVEVVCGADGVMTHSVPFIAGQRFFKFEYEVGN